MPLFVPVLRLVMVFLNVYDSYKVLKMPRASARNSGQPSQRALTQRKRDMKGCIAVWIVWCCFITYERFAEAIVSLFVPFYDEFKSLAILFLILTRARGAEPIFLHILRPLLKPYTPTLDVVLDFACMIGDIIFTLSMLPIRVVLSWWEKSIFNRDATSESETESMPVEHNNVHSDVDRLYPGVLGQAQPHTLQLPREVSSNPRQSGHSRSSSSDFGQNATQGNRLAQKDDVQRVASNSMPNGLYSHQIWHPPPPSYSDADDETATGPIPNIGRSRHDSEDLVLLAKMEEIARQQVDEWRQYPPFPSAYPSTPIVTASSRLPNNPIRPPQRPLDTVLTEMSEDEPQQDFRESLLLPRKPLNPSYVGLSDDYFTHPGVQIDRLVDDEMAVDIDSIIDDEEEDEFNITLRTPLPLLGSARSHIRDTDYPISFVSSAVSKSTASTIADRSSSLLSRSSSESSLSAAMSMISSTDSSSVVGKKRPFPRNTAVSVKNKAQLINGTVARSTPRMRGILKPPARRLFPTRKVRREPVPSTNETVSEDTTSSVGVVDEHKAHITKRRKIALPPGHVLPSSRPIRGRITAPARAAQTRRNTAAPSASSRSSARIRVVTQPPNTVKQPDITSNDHAAGRSHERNFTKTN